MPYAVAETNFKAAPPTFEIIDFVFDQRSIVRMLERKAWPSGDVYKRQFQCLSHLDCAEGIIFWRPVEPDAVFFLHLSFNANRMGAEINICQKIEPISLTQACTEMVSQYQRQIEGTVFREAFDQPEKIRLRYHILPVFFGVPIFIDLSDFHPYAWILLAILAWQHCIIHRAGQAGQNSGNTAPG